MDTNRHKRENVTAENLERLNDTEWRRHVARSFEEVNARLSAGQESFRELKCSISKIEKNTSLARNMQTFSTATSLVYTTIARFSMPLFKGVLWCVAIVIFVYMMTHGGAVPAWAKPWLSFMERMV